MIRRVVARVLGAPLEVADAPAPADAIVILGAPLRAGGALSEVVAERVAAGFGLWRGGAAPIACVTGGPSRKTTEADAMADALRALGVPPHALRVEREARTTAENASLTAALLARDGVRTVWLVSQPFHLRRARRLFRHAGLEVRAFRIPDGLQDRAPERALVWIVREYGAWARALLRRP
jgi:uncharacterized SAM-binding protein YcdF (DUF218 family)